MRILAGVLAGALAVSVSPLLGLTSAGALEPATGDGSVCEDAAAEPFTDVSDTDSAVNEIACLFTTGITTGVTATTYEPLSPVTRRQMALFLVRMADEIEDKATGAVTPLPASDGVNAFTDIADEAAEIKAAIDRLDNAGVTTGVTPTTFVPEANVTRRQMAKFIVRLQEFMFGEDITPDNAPDAFTDDDGDSGEAELNVLAAEGVFLGNGAPNTGTVSPGADITRRQMAFVIVRKLQYLFEEGEIGRLFAEDDGNAAFGTSPTGDQVVALGAGGTGGTQDITFTGLGTAPVDVALVPCYDDEIQDNSGFFTFLDQDEDNLFDTVSGSGETRMGNAELISVNSEPVGSTTFDDNAAPVAGAISVRVRSTDVDCVRILVWTDADDDDALDLDAANQPTEDFGISGMLTWHNGEAPAGTDPHDYIVFIDKTAGFFILEDGFLYNYDAADIFGIDDVAPEDQITFAEFELAANNNRFNDEIDMQSVTGYSPTGQNRYALDHEVSNIPTGLAAGTSGDLDGDADDSDTPFTWVAPNPLNGLIEDYTVDIYVDAAQTDCDSGAPVTSWTSDVGATTVTAEDLGDGAFCAVVYATTFDGNDSYDSEPVRFVVDTGQAPIITSATLTTDAVTEGEADTGDVWTLAFNEEMDPLTVPGATFTLTDADGDSILVECKAPAADTVTDAGCVLGNGADATVLNDTLVITLGEDAQDRNAAGAGDILYPLTITASTILTDLDDGDTVNVAGSTDVTIG